MNAETLGDSRILNLLFKPAGALMESRFRRWPCQPRAGGMGPRRRRQASPGRAGRPRNRGARLR